MSLPQPPISTKRKTLTAYVSIWVVLGGFALAYLTLLGLRPDALAGLSPAGDADPNVVALQRDVTRALADLDPLRNTLGEMKADVANLKTGFRAAKDRDVQLAKRLIALEQPSPGVQDNVSAQTNDSTAPVAPRPTPINRKGAGAAANPQVLNANPIDTASVSRQATAPTATPPSTVAPVAAKLTPAKKKEPVKAPVKKVAATMAPAKEPPKAVGVQLATGPSLASLQLNWSVLTDRNKDALGHLQPRYTTRGKQSNPAYDLVAGPLGSTQQAEIVCKVLSDRGHACKVGAYRGNVLPPT
jgi:hypothetical protein